MHYVWMVIVGFVVGLIARAVMPGDQKLGLIMTAVLGIVGSLVAGFIGQAIGWYQAGQGAGFIGSVVGALIVLFVYMKVVAKPGGSGGSSS
ncbi:MAG: GlsB/YeaQ/YmgE family stress response membrane protein [Burkholderiaceae bacterium]|nr:MAG: GlsB/YeaQ/YmgE family stress response membrane protein [Burkholderiaceae bacterium]MBE7425177.1 GlsB/YeaQ/YmgE family stress response membrane protein [Ideonella sp.]MCC7287779.1 GlsB/YeaQ/YmgE family stress response membrane protein [Burkholderiaceae bacterium]